MEIETENPKPQEEAEFIDRIDFFDTKCRKILLAGRIFFAAFLWIYNIARLATEKEYLTWLTSWANIFVAVYYLLICLHYKFPQLKLACLHAFEVSWAFQFSITIAFWCILFKPYADEFGVDNVLLWIGGFFGHGFLSIVLWGEIISCKIELNKRHLIVTYIIGCMYFIFNCAYTLEVKQIYPLINYKNAVTYIMLFVFIFCVWFSFIVADFLGKLKKEYVCYSVV